MLLPLLVSLLGAPVVAQAQSTVVAVGDSPRARVVDADGAAGAPISAGGPVSAGGPPLAPVTARSGAPGTVPSGWVAVLADCLEERAPRAWTVVDRAALGDSPTAVRERVGSLRELGPRVVVLGVGAREVGRAGADVDAFRDEVTRIVGELRQVRPPPGVLLLGLVPPTAAQLPASDEQAALDERARTYDAALRELAREDGVHHLDLQRDWPAEPAARAALTVDGWRLTDQGHARVAATACDAILSHFGAATPAP